jgi:hypothetical protein
LGLGAGVVGATAPPARRRRRGARLQLLGGDAGSRGPRASSLPPALPLPSPTSSLPRFLVEAMDLDWGAVPQGGGGGTGKPAGAWSLIGGRLGFGGLEMDDGDPRRPCLRPRGTHPTAPARWGRQPWGGAAPYPTARVTPVTGWKTWRKRIDGERADPWTPLGSETRRWV